jgi:predicted Zn-dependent protease
MNLFSHQQDVELGRDAAEEILKKTHVTQDRILQDYAAKIGRRLARQQEAVASGFEFDFTVIDEKAVNAFALPGGPMFINTGLLKAVDTEAELAGVMGHEMSHVILRHGTNQLSKQNLLTVPAVLAEALVGNDSLFAALTRSLVGFGVNAALLRYSRENEREADALGARLAAEAGYDPRELAHFFEKLKAQSGGASGDSKIIEFLSDHPNPGNREELIIAEARALPNSRYNFQTGVFPRMKRELYQSSR